MDGFKIIGSGAIVRRFLGRFAANYSDIQFAIYAQKTTLDFPSAKNVQGFPIENFSEDERPTLVCCSVSEENILRENGGDKNRSIVAHANIKLIRSLIEQRIFNRGIYFVLTNPSEVVGQYIAEQTANPNVYSLGLSVDYVRYKNIFSGQKIERANADFQLAGNHWNRSFPIFDGGASFSRRELDNLYEQYRSEVQKDFDDFRPPIQSGADAINHLVKAFVDQVSIPLSGPERTDRNFTGGIFHTKTRQFVPTKASGLEGKNLYQEILGQHESLMAEVRA